MTIKLVGIGGMGLMLSPSAKHLKPGGTARFLRIHDRGTKDERRDLCRLNKGYKNSIEILKTMRDPKFLKAV